MDTCWDRLMEFLLTTLDFMMDVVTLGEWSRMRGDVTPNITIRKMR